MNHFYRLAIALSVSLAGPASAGTIEVTLHHRDGWPIADQDIHLIPLSAYREAAREGWHPSPVYEIEKTDHKGRAIFSGLPAATFTANVFGRLKDPLLVKPTNNPLASAQVVTLHAEDDMGRIQLELWPGVPISLEIAGLDDLPLDGFNAIFRDAEKDVRVQSVSFRSPRLEHVLAPIAWEVSVDPRRGFELVGLERDDHPLESETAHLDLAREPRETHLRFAFTASPIVPEGVVKTNDLSNDDAPLQIGIEVSGARHAVSVLEIYPLADLSEPVRSATVIGRNSASIPDLPPGDYLVVVGGPNTLEARAELRNFDGDAERRTLEVVLEPGASIRLQALDGDDRPVEDLDVEIERIDDGPEVLLSHEGFRDAKQGRQDSVGPSGWVEATGFYPGRYRLRPRLRRANAADFEIYLGLDGGELTADTEFEIEIEYEPVEIEARVLPKSTGLQALDE